MKVVTSSQELLTIESYEASESKPSLPVRISPPTIEGTSADCDDDGGASVCTRNGHAAIVATPKPVVGQLMIAPGGSPFGLGPMPPPARHRLAPCV